MIMAAGHAVLSRMQPQFFQSIDSTIAAVAISLLAMLVIIEVRNALARYYRASPGNNLPGPWGIPILGNVLQMGSAPHATFSEMAKKYGDVFRIHIGSRMVVVLNGYDTIRQALVKQSIDFAGRPDDLTTFKYINTWKGFPTLSFANYSDSWKLHRKIAESSFRHFTSGSQVTCVEQKVEEEVTDLINVLTNNNNNDANIMDPENIIKASVANILYSFILSRRRPLDDQHLIGFLSMSEKFDRAAGSGNAVDFMPWLRFFPNKKLRDFKEILANMANLLQPDIDNHHAEYRDGSDRDMLDHLITESRSIDAKVTDKMGITEQQILGSVSDFFGAGFATVSSVLYWMILYAMKYTNVQQRIHREIDMEVGRDRLPNLSDRGHLPFTEAFILESLRYSSVVPLSIPHATTKDTTLNGYHIPKDTVVFVNLYSVAFDESRWADPKQFNPSRFLNIDGSGLDPGKTDLLMPFGAGRRRCIGSELGRTELFLYCTHLMHQCSFETPDEKTELNFKPQFGLTQRPQPYKVKIRRRKPIRIAADLSTVNR